MSRIKKKFISGVVLLHFSLILEAHTEVVTIEEAQQVGSNWLTYMVAGKGAWAGKTMPQLMKGQEIIDGGGLLGYYFPVEPSGFIIVPVLKELPAIKAYSEEYQVDFNDRQGFPALIREQLRHRLDLYSRQYGSVNALQPRTGAVLFERENKVLWQFLLKDEKQFRNDITQGALGEKATVGPLLSTTWHQSAPYNNLCPDGDRSCSTCPGGGSPASRTLVGCVSTASSQILRYWSCPLRGEGTHSYDWDGDDSCDGSTSGETVNATFSDRYNWAKMPDSCTVISPQEEQNAVAELCYEVGVAFEMDYGVCASSATTADALDVFPTYFGFNSFIDRENRGEHTPSSWFSIIKGQIDNGWPILYRIKNHAIVCDGWEEIGENSLYHMNYGWNDGFTAWYALDNLHCDWDGCGIGEEYLIRNIAIPCRCVFVDKFNLCLFPDGEMGCVWGFGGPFTSVMEGVSSAGPGDLLYIKAGTYDEIQPVLFNKSLSLFPWSGDVTILP